MINVDSSLQLYTMIVSWKYYGVIWSLLVSTGIVFIPIVMAIVETLLAARANGSMIANDSEGMLSGLETKLVSIFVVMLFISMPATPFNLTPDTVQVINQPNKATTPYNFGPTGSCGNTGSAFDDIRTADGSDVCGGRAAVPIWWYGVLRVSHAITQVLVGELTSATNIGFRQMVQFARSGKIVNPALQSLVNTFEGECYQVALMQFSQATSNSSDTPTPGVIATGGAGTTVLGQTVDWQGATFLVENFYPGIITDSFIPIEVVAFQEENNRAIDVVRNPPIGGQVDCGSLWARLRTDVLNESLSPIAGTHRAGHWARFLIWAPGTSEAQENLLIRNYIAKSNPQSSQTTERINSAKDRGQGTLKQLADSFTEFYQAEEFVKLSLYATILTDALVKALPLIQAYVLMFVVFMLPFGLVLSGYSWGFILQSSVLLFFVIFWSAIWAFAAWVDDTMANALWPGLGDGIFSGIQSYVGIGVDNQSWEQGTNKLIHSIVTAALYIGGPIFCGYVLTAAGFRTAAFAAPNGGTATSTVGTGGVAPLASSARANANYIEKQLSKDNKKK